MLNLQIADDRGIASAEEQKAAVVQGAAALTEAKTGEACYADSLGWLHVDEWANDAILTHIEQLAAAIRAECDAFVLIGVGGSNNAARSVIEALRTDDAPEIIYAGNTLSPHALNKMLHRLAGKTFAIDCIAKNFETLEPGSSFRLLRKAMAERFTEDQIRRWTICTGTPGSSLEQLAKQAGYTFVPFPTDIGGRYTAVSYVGLLPMAVAGIDIRQLTKGAADMEQELRTASGEDNPALRYAALRQLYHQKGYALELLSSFEPQLSWFYKWWIQLFAESEGKDGKGIYPVAAEYSEELHAVGQFIQDGAPLMFETFLKVQQPDHLPVPQDAHTDYFDYLNGKDFAEINEAAFRATVTAHSQKLPCLLLEIPTIDAYHFGQLFYFFEFACYISCKLAGVNPFDQPGVEAYKGWMFRALGK